PRLQVRLDLVAVDSALQVIRDEDHHHVGPLRDLAHVGGDEARSLRLRARSAGRRQPDADADAAVLQVERVRVPLRPVADDRDLAFANERQVSVVVVVHRRHVTPLRGRTTKTRFARYTEQLLTSPLISGAASPEGPPAGFAPLRRTGASPRLLAARPGLTISPPRAGRTHF